MHVLTIARYIIIKQTFPVRKSLNYYRVLSPSLAVHMGQNNESYFFLFFEGMFFWVRQFTRSMHRRSMSLL